MSHPQNPNRHPVDISAQARPDPGSTPDVEGRTLSEAAPAVEKTHVPRGKVERCAIVHDVPLDCPLCEAEARGEVVDLACDHRLPSPPREPPKDLAREGQLGGGGALSSERALGDRAFAWVVLLALVLLAWALLPACGDNIVEEPATDATPVDAATDATPDACVCEVHWPACPPGCAPPVDGGADSRNADEPLPVPSSTVAAPVARVAPFSCNAVGAPEEPDSSAAALRTFSRPPRRPRRAPRSSRRRARGPAGERALRRTVVTLALGAYNAFLTRELVRIRTRVETLRGATPVEDSRAKVAPARRATAVVRTVGGAR